MRSVVEFRTEVRTWLRTALTGEFAALRGRGGRCREHEAFAERLARDRHVAAEGSACHIGGQLPGPTLVSRERTDWQRPFLLSRADARHAGSETRHTDIAEPVLGLPKEARP